MAISTIFKGVFFAWLLVGVFSQTPGENASPSESSPPAEAPAPLEATPAPLEATPAPLEAAPIRLRVANPATPKKTLVLDAAAIAAREAEEKLLEEQATHAVYEFATSIVDGIMDNMQLRSESRNGLNLTGSYSYSDGYFRRTVHYVADENGFRILSEEVEPLGNGPRVNPEGQAQIYTSIAGEELEYNITKADIGPLNQPTKVPGRA